MPRKPSPSLAPDERAAWTELLDLGDRFRDMAPWRWMKDQPLFGVRLAPGTPTYYCSILGGLGETFGLLLYDGPEGWASFQAGIEGATDPLDGPYSQHALTLFFSDREDVGPATRALLKDLGRTYRGRGQWPEAQVHRPGLVPRMPTIDEVRLMAQVAAEAIGTCERARREPLPVDGSLLVRCLGADLWEQRPRVDLAAVPVAPLDDVSLQRLSRLERRGGIWLGDHSYLPMRIEEGPHPYFPRHGLWMDPMAGFILDMDVMDPALEPEARLRSRLLDLMSQHGVPDTIVVRRQSTARALEGLKGIVRIQVDPNPAPLFQVLDGLIASMTGG
jgi:hypothetical protein